MVTELVGGGTVAPTICFSSKEFLSPTLLSGFGGSGGLGGSFGGSGGLGGSFGCSSLIYCFGVGCLDIFMLLLQ